MKKLKSEKILSISICSSEKSDILRVIQKRIASEKSTVIFTPNPQMILSAQDSKEGIKLLNSSNINIPDGTGIILASRLSGGKIKKRISGIDLATSLLSIAEQRGYRVFLLGAKPGVAKKAQKRLKKQFPRLNICGAHHGYFKRSESRKIIKSIKESHADLLFVCLGSPAQEKWIIQSKPMLKRVKLYMGLGGSLDVWSGNTKRAPRLLQSIGLEWLYRTLKEPGRARIFLDIPRFLYAVLKNK